MDVNAQRDWLTLLRMPGIGPATVRRLLETFPTPAETLAALRRVHNNPLPRDRAGPVRDYLGRVARGDMDHRLDADLQWLTQDDRHLLCLGDERYPAKLTQIAAPPLVLFVQGTAEDLQRPAIAVVGSRRSTVSGRQHTTELVQGLAASGLLVISGLAIGIDGVAHEAALALAGGRSVAVLGSGLADIYPRRHRQLAQRLTSRGALVSEFPPYTPPRPHHFPRRNRIISGLSDGVIVVQAARLSGSLITARYALEQGREVFAVPGAMSDPLSSGCHDLIKDGAKLVTRVEDVLEELPGQYQAVVLPPRRAAPQAFSSESQTVLDALTTVPQHIDTVAAAAGMPVQQLTPLLLQMELRGLVSCEGGGYSRVQ